MIHPLVIVSEHEDRRLCSERVSVAVKRSVEAWMEYCADAMNVLCFFFCVCDGRAWIILVWIGCKCPMVVVVCMTCATYNACIVMRKGSYDAVE